MLQVVDEVLANPADRTKVSLVFGNVSEADILLKDELCNWARMYPHRLQLYLAIFRTDSKSES